MSTTNIAYICEGEKDDKVDADVVDRHTFVYGISNENVTNHINLNGEEDIIYNKAETHSSNPHTHEKIISGVRGLHGS